MISSKLNICRNNDDIMVVFVHNRLLDIVWHGAIGTVSWSRYMARLRATGADLGTGHKNNIRWMTVVTSD